MISSLKAATVRSFKFLTKLLRRFEAKPEKLEVKILINFISASCFRFLMVVDLKPYRIEL